MDDSRAAAQMDLSKKEFDGDAERRKQSFPVEFDPRKWPATRADQLAAVQELSRALPRDEVLKVLRNVARAVVIVRELAGEEKREPRKGEVRE